MGGFVPTFGTAAGGTSVFASGTVAGSCAPCATGFAGATLPGPGKSGASDSGGGPSAADCGASSWAGGPARNVAAADPLDGGGSGGSGGRLEACHWVPSW